MLPPPDAVLAHFDLDALLDSAASAIPGSTPFTLSSQAAVPHQRAQLQPLSESNTMAAAAAEAASGVLDAEALAEAVRQDPDVSLHAELYHMLAQCEPDVFEHLSADNLIQQQGHEQIVEYVQLTRLDLCYHPWRYESWERVLSESSLCFCLACCSEFQVARQTRCIKSLACPWQSEGMMPHHTKL